MLQIKGHCCYIGETGYNYHSKGLFRALSKYNNLYIRNFTIDTKFIPDEIDKLILSEQSYFDQVFKSLKSYAMPWNKNILYNLNQMN